MGDAMTKDILIIVRHGPYGGFQAAEALRHANGLISLGFRPIVILVDDGVYLAKEGQEPGQSQWLALSETFDEVIARGLYEKKDDPAEFYVEKESDDPTFLDIAEAHRKQAETECAEDRQVEGKGHGVSTVHGTMKHVNPVGQR